MTKKYPKRDSPAPTRNGTRDEKRQTGVIPEECHELENGLVDPEGKGALKTETSVGRTKIGSRKVKL